MNLKTIVSGQGGSNLFVTAIFTPEKEVSDERLQSLKDILDERLRDMDATKYIGSIATIRHDLCVKVVSGKIVVSMQYQHMGGYWPAATGVTQEEHAAHDTVAILEHLKQYLTAFEE